MARKRMLDPMIWDDPDFAQLGRDERLLFIGLISQADDYGHVTGNPATLRKWVFGYDDLTVTEVAAMRDRVVAQCRNVDLYQVDGQDYLWLKTWQRHQDLRFRAKAQYPCHVCGQYHTSADYQRCETPAAQSAPTVQVLTQPCASTTQEPRETLTQPLRPRGEKRGEEKRRENHLRGDEPSPKEPASLSERQAVFAAIANQCGYNVKRLTSAERKELNDATAQLVNVGYRAGDIDLMVSNWSEVMGDQCLMTPHALAKHATKLLDPPLRAGPVRGRSGPSGPALEYVN